MSVVDLVFGACVVNRSLHQPNSCAPLVFQLGPLLKMKPLMRGLFLCKSETRLSKESLTTLTPQVSFEKVKESLSFWVKGEDGVTMIQLSLHLPIMERERDSPFDPLTVRTKKLRQQTWH